MVVGGGDDDDDDECTDRSISINPITALLQHHW